MNGNDGQNGSYDENEQVENDTNIMNNNDNDNRNGNVNETETKTKADILTGNGNEHSERRNETV